MLFEHYVRFHSFIKVRVAGWPPVGGGCSLGLRLVLWVLMSNCRFFFFFFALVFGVVVSFS